MERNTSSQTGFVSINEAAAFLGVKPWEVRRLIEADQLDTRTLVSVASLRQHKQESA